MWPKFIRGDGICKKSLIHTFNMYVTYAACHLPTSSTLCRKTVLSLCYKHQNFQLNKLLTNEASPHQSYKIRCMYV